MQTDTRESLQRQLETLRKNLAALEEQKAKMGLDVTVRVLNEIDDTKQQIAEFEDRLAYGDFEADGRFLGMRPPHIYHNLPQPDYGTFVGREKELAQVHRILRPYPHSQEHLVTIDGIGGVGKSALAIEAAYHYLRDCNRLPQEERFEAIVWTSAKSSVLSADGIIPRQQATRTLDDIYTTISVTLEREDITRAPFKQQDELVRRALTRQRTLLIVDNLETVDDERVNTFLRELPAPTKAIVTTRHRIDVAYPVRIEGMDKSECLDLIADEAKRRGITLSDDEARQLFRRTGGVPLVIVWSIAQMGFGYGVEAILARLGQPTSDIAKFCFDVAMERIRGEPAHKLLMGLSLFTTDASREALGYVADLPVLDRDEGLVKLEKLSLANKRGNRFHLLPLTSAYSQAELAKEPPLKNSFRERWVEYLLGFLIEESQHEYKGLENINTEMDNILNAMEWCWRVNDLETFVAFLEKISFYLRATGRWAPWNRYLELALETEMGQADFLVWLASMRFLQDDLDESQVYVEKAIKIYRLSDDKSGLALALWRLASIQIERGEYEKAKINLDEALKIAEQAKDERIAIRIQRRLAMIDMAKENYSSAEIRLRQSRDLREQDTEVSSGLATTYRLLGQVSFLKQEYELASQYYQRTLEIGVQINSPENIAQAKEHIAELELTLGNLNRAKEMANEAIEEFSKLGMRRNLRKTQALLERINAELA